MNDLKFGVRPKNGNTFSCTHFLNFEFFHTQKLLITFTFHSQSQHYKNRGVPFRSVPLCAARHSCAGRHLRAAVDNAGLAGARLPIHVDIGFGDAIIPGAQDIDYPSLLDLPQPRLRAYPPETVVAEKFQAMTALGMINTRMKDFFDVWAISNTIAFEGSVLAGAS